MDKNKIYTTALMWQPIHFNSGCHGSSRPKTTWRTAVQTERDKLEMNGWSRVKTAAKDRDKWRQMPYTPRGVKRIGEVVINKPFQDFRIQLNTARQSETSIVRYDKTTYRY